jgi:molybdopterin/thiamine biosynthesis adenylyltransferase
MVLDAGATADAASAASIEQHAPEPFSDYYQYQHGSIVLIAGADDGRARVPAGALCGVIVIGIEGAPANERPNPVLRGALLELRDEAGTVLIRAPENLAGRYPLRITGRWSRLTDPVRGVKLDDVPAAVFTAAHAADPSGRRPQSFDTSQEGCRISLRAALFPEEHRWRGESDSIGDGWAFAVQVQRRQATAAAKRGKKTPRKMRGAPAGSTPPSPAYYLARPGRYSLGDLAARAPELMPLRECAVAVFGLGCLGAPSAFEFARASVGGLRLLDHDIVDPATTIRWPLGVLVAGVLKAPALAQIIGSHYPYVDVRAEVHQIGAPRATAPGGEIDPESEQAILARMVDGASLLFDATAEWGVQRFLADLARRKRMPYVGVHSTPGGWGGLVVRIVPARTEGCWICLQHWCGESEERGGIPAPPHDATGGDIQPRGCADPTYAGANVDLAEVALMGVRMAIGALTAGATGRYPDASWDVAVLSLRDKDGKIIPPTWRTFALRRHPACAECRERMNQHDGMTTGEDTEPVGAAAEVSTTA